MKASQDERVGQSPTPPRRSREGEGGRQADPRDAPVKLVAGKPCSAANRTRTAEENARRSFERNGETLGPRPRTTMSPRSTPSSAIRPRARRR
ncbi:hypothetical protein ACRAWD_17265 [Caulobacter segnis]